MAYGLEFRQNGVSVKPWTEELGVLHLLNDSNVRKGAAKAQKQQEDSRLGHKTRKSSSCFGRMESTKNHY